MTKKTFGSMGNKDSGVQPRGILTEHREAVEKGAPKPPKKLKKDPLDRKITVYFTENEKAAIEAKSGLAPESKVIRQHLLTTGFFDR